MCIESDKIGRTDSEGGKCIMNNKFWKKGTVFVVLALLLGTSLLPTIMGNDLTLNTYNSMIDSEGNLETEKNQSNVTICIKKYDPQKGIVEIPIGSVSLEKANMLKDEFKKIWDEHQPLTEKMRTTLLLLDKETNLKIPIEKFIEFLSDYQRCASDSMQQTDSEDMFNFISFWGALCFGQPNVYLVGGNLSRKKILSYEDPEGEQWNLSLFGEYGIAGIMLPFIGWGYIGTLGLLGYQHCPSTMDFPNTFFAILFGVLFVSISFKIGNPYLSVFELYFGVSGIPIAFPI